MTKKSKSFRALSSIMLGLVFLLNTASVFAVELNDIDSSADYAKESIMRLAEEGVISGDENRMFNPQKTIKRSEMVKMIVKSQGINTDNISPRPRFSDVPQSHWAYKYVEAAYREGIIQGTGNDKFNADKETTRQEMITMFVRSLGEAKRNIKNVDQSYPSIEKFRDKSSIAVWAKDYVEFGVANNIIEGYGEAFGPNDYAQKQQVAVVTDRFMINQDNIKKTLDELSNVAQYPDLYEALSVHLLGVKGHVDSEIEVAISDDYNNFQKTSIAMSGVIDSPNTEEVNFDIDLDIAVSNPDGSSHILSAHTVLLDGIYYAKYSHEDSWIVKTLAELEEEGVQLNSPQLVMDRAKELLSHYDNFEIIQKENITVDEQTGTAYYVTLNEAGNNILFENMNIAQKGISIEEFFNNGHEIDIMYLVNDSNQVIYQEQILNGTLFNEEVQENMYIETLSKASFYNMGEAIEIEAPQIEDSTIELSDSVRSIEQK